MIPNFTPLIALGNEAPVSADSGCLAPGSIALANESRFSSTHYSEALTQFAVGYKDPENLLAAVDYIAPPVSTGRMFHWKKGDSSEYFLSEIDDERSLGAGFTKVQYAGGSALGETKNRGLTTVIDTDANGGVFDEESTVGLLQQRIIRNKYRRAITALMAMSAGDATAFTGAAAPDELLRSLLATASTSGAQANRGLIGLIAWNLRSAAYQSSEKTAAAIRAVMKPAELAGDLFLDDLRVDKALYTVNQTTKARIVGSNFFAFCARDGLSKDDPSNLKQFYTPCGAGRFRVYRKVTGPADKFIEITVEHYENIIATSTLGVVRANIT